LAARRSLNQEASFARSARRLLSMMRETRDRIVGELRDGLGKGSRHAWADRRSQAKGEKRRAQPVPQSKR
jgi:hypothetical protein